MKSAVSPVRLQCTWTVARRKTPDRRDARRTDWPILNQTNPHLFHVNPCAPDQPPDDPKGWLMLAAGGVLLGVGSFWMSRLIKVEV